MSLLSFLKWYSAEAKCYTVSYLCIPSLCTIMYVDACFPFLFLQSVEEAECQRAYDLAADRYMASFDRSKPPEEVSTSAFDR